MRRTRGFWSFVLNEDDDPDSCWIWCGALNSCGYGIYRIHGQIRKAHRLAYELDGHELPAGVVLRSLCGNPQCVRPDHHELGRPFRKLSDDEVQAIRAALLSSGHLARAYGVSARHVRAIKALARRTCAEVGYAPGVGSR